MRNSVDIIKVPDQGVWVHWKGDYSDLIMRKALNTRTGCPGGDKSLVGLRKWAATLGSSSGRELWAASNQQRAKIQPPQSYSHKDSYTLPTKWKSLEANTSLVEPLMRMHLAKTLIACCETPEQRTHLGCAQKCPMENVRYYYTSSFKLPSLW